MIQAVLADWRTAPMSDQLRAMLGFLEKLTLDPDAIGPDDVAPLRTAGLSDEAIEDAIHVCAAFSMIVRLADSFDFELQTDEGYAASARMLLKRGYVL